MEFTGVAPGEYYVNVTHVLRTPDGKYAGSRSSHTDLNVQDGKTTKTELAITSGTASVSGTIRMNVEPQEGAMVQIVLRPEERASETMDLMTDANGHFRFDALHAGKARLYASKSVSEGKSLTRQVTFELSNNQTTQADVELTGGGKIGGAVSGIRLGDYCHVRVIRGVISVPAKPGPTYLRDLTEQGLEAAGADVENATGAYMAQGLEPGEYTVIVTAVDPKLRIDEDILANRRFTAGTATVHGEEAVTVNLALR